MECLLDWKSEHHVSLVAQTERVLDERGGNIPSHQPIDDDWNAKNKCWREKKMGKCDKDFFLNVEAKHNDVIGRK